MLAAEVHVVKGRGQEVLEMRRVLSNLLLIFLLGNQIDSPTFVQLGNEMNALGVVDAVLFPTLGELAL